MPQSLTMLSAVRYRLFKETVYNSDYKTMSLKSIFDMVVAVVTNKYVIITFVGIAVYISFINYIIHYRKRSPLKKAKLKKALAKASETPAPAPAPAPENAEASE